MSDPNADLVGKSWHNDTTQRIFKVIETSAWSPEYVKVEVTDTSGTGADFVMASQAKLVRRHLQIIEG